MDAKVMATYEPKTAKKVYVYRNGLANANPKLLVVNERQVRDFSTFLTRVTSGLKAPVAIRNIYTPSGGHRVRGLGDLESGRHYVAGGNEHFKKVNYSSVPRLLTRRPTRVEFTFPHRAAQAVVASARYKRPVEKPFIIHVFRNGDEQFRGARILLQRRIMASWEHVLELITEKTDLYTPAKRLCTLDGRMVHAVSELQDGGKYVVIEGSRPFRRVAYCATEPIHTSPLHKASPQHKKKLYTVPRLRPHNRRRTRRKLPTLPPEGGPGDSQPEPPMDEPPPLPPSLLLLRRKSRPMAGRKNKEARERAILDHREDSIFGGSPVPMRDVETSQAMPSPPPPRLSETDFLAATTDTLDTSFEEPPTPAILPAKSPVGVPPGEQPTMKDGDRERRSRERERGAKPKRRERRDINATTEGTSTSETATSEDDRRVNSGMAAAKEEKALSSSLGSSKGSQGVFYASSGDKAKEEKSQPMGEFTDGSEGEAVFRAKLQHTETQDAEAVQESKDIQVERPVDLEEAEEVAEEEEEEEVKEKEIEEREESAVKQDIRELQSRPRKTSIDLSVNRVHAHGRGGGGEEEGGGGETSEREEAEGSNGQLPAEDQLHREQTTPGNSKPETLQSGASTKSKPGSATSVQEVPVPATETQGKSADGSTTGENTESAAAAQVPELEEEEEEEEVAAGGEQAVSAEKQVVKEEEEEIKEELVDESIPKEEDQKASDLTAASEDGKDESNVTAGGDSPGPAQTSTGSGPASPTAQGSVEGEKEEEDEKERKEEAGEEVKEEIEEELPGETTFVIEGDS